MKRLLLIALLLAVQSVALAAEPLSVIVEAHKVEPYKWQFNGAPGFKLHYEITAKHLAGRSPDYIGAAFYSCVSGNERLLRIDAESGGETIARMGLPLEERKHEPGTKYIHQLEIFDRIHEAQAGPVSAASTVTITAWYLTDVERIEHNLESLNQDYLCRIYGGDREPEQKSRHYFGRQVGKLRGIVGCSYPQSPGEGFWLRVAAGTPMETRRQIVALAEKYRVAIHEFSEVPGYESLLENGQ